MLDEERILAKVDELKSYLDELRKIIPEDLKSYKSSIEKRRACERLLHISIECVMDICSIIVSNLRLGLPSEEGVIIEKLRGANVISERMKNKLRRMRGFRNILVHRYGRVKDELVYKVLTENLGDFDKFINEIIAFLKGK